MKFMVKRGETTPIVFDEKLFDAEVYEEWVPVDSLVDEKPARKPRTAKAAGGFVDTVALPPAVESVVNILGDLD